MITNLVHRIRNIPKGVRASVAFFVSSLVTAGISYITTPLYTRILPAEVFGNVSVFMTWLQIFGIIAMFCLSYGVFNNGMMDFPKQRDEYSFSMLVLSNLITLGFSGLLFLLRPFLEKYAKLPIEQVVLMICVFVFQPAYNFWNARQRFEYKYKWTMFWAIFCAFISPSVAIIAIVLSRDKLNARIFGAEIPLIIVYAGFYLYIARKARFRLNRSFWKSALIFNFPLIPHYLSTYMLNSSDKLMISALVNDTAVAYYSVAYSVASLASIVWTAINASLLPFTYEKCKKEEFDKISSVTMLILTFFSMACMCVILLGPEAVKFMATANYLEAIYVIPPVVGGVFFQVQYYIYANILYYYKKPKYVMFASASSMILNIVLNYFFIKKYGYVAAGYTTLFCFMIQALIDYISLRKAIKIKIYNGKFLLLLSAIVFILSIIAKSLYRNGLIYILARYIIFSLIILIFAINFKKIKESMTNN